MSDHLEGDTVEILAAHERKRPPSASIQVDFAGVTHVGKVRPNNEDHFLTARGGRWLELIATNLPDGELPDFHEERNYLMIVADGMGGMAAGEVASRMALSSGIKQVLRQSQWRMHISSVEVQAVLDRMVEILRKIDWTLTRAAQADPALTGMGTTMTVGYSLGIDLFVAHVGDSRAYLYRNGRLQQLTNDQTAAQALLDAGRLTPEEASRHWLRHVLTQAIGGRGGRLSVQVQHLQIENGDQLLLCTDGLFNMVEDAVIAGVLRNAAAANEGCQTLLNLALDGGGKDNVTLTLARYSVPEA
jgi:protein phosphatase